MVDVKQGGAGVVHRQTIGNGRFLDCIWQRRNALKWILYGSILLAPAIFSRQQSFDSQDRVEGGVRKRDASGDTSGDTSRDNGQSDSSASSTRLSAAVEPQSSKEVLDSRYQLVDDPLFECFSRDGAPPEASLPPQRSTPPSLDELRYLSQEGMPSPLNLDIVKRVDNFIAGRDGAAASTASSAAKAVAESPVFFAQWEHPAEADKFWTDEDTSFLRLVCPGSVAIDIGAHGGDTTLPLAVAAGAAGLVIAFEPGPPWEILKSNVWINPAYRIHAYNFAIDQYDGEWCYTSQCMGCNGGKIECDAAAANARPGSSRVTKLISHRLDQVLDKNYHDTVRDNITFIKIDAEGFDSVIVSSLKSLLSGNTNTNTTATTNSGHDDDQQQQQQHPSPKIIHPVFKIEWYNPYRTKVCSEGTKKIFESTHEIGYDVYALKKKQTDAVKNNGTSEIFELKSSCQDLVGDDSQLLRDLYLFSKEYPPYDQSTRDFNGGAWRHCP